MDAKTVINDSMTLDEKLAAIDAAMATAIAKEQTSVGDVHVHGTYI